MFIPEWIYVALSLVSGLIVGSFLNVVVARLPLGVSIVRPRSSCPSCKTGIAWYDNIPLFSFLLLRGKCRTCGVSISVRYPVIEVMTAVLFLASMLRFGASPVLWLRDWPLLAILVAVTFIDLEHRLIPDILSLGGLVLALTAAGLDPRLGWVSSALGAAIGFGLFYLLAWGYQRYSGKVGLGGGDIKLLALLGAFLGPGGVLATILISSVLGSVIGILWAVVRKEKNVLGVSIPYGPFLVIGGLYYYLLGDLLWFQFTNPM